MTTARAYASPVGTFQPDSKNLPKRSSLASRVDALLPRTEYRRMDSGEDREAVFRLRYDAYRREDRIPENDSGLSVDFADEQPNTSTFGVFINCKLCSSIRLSILSSAYPVSPSVAVFGDTVTGLIEPGRVFVDPTRFVTDYRAARDYSELPFLTLRIATMAGLYFNAEKVFSTVRSNHVGFYQRMFLAEPLSELVFYEPMNMEVRLMSIMPNENRAEIRERYPFFDLNYLEARQLFGPVSDTPGIEKTNQAVPQATREFNTV